MIILDTVYTAILGPSDNGWDGLAILFIQNSSSLQNSVLFIQSSYLNFSE